MGVRGPLHDGYMRTFIEMFYASQAGASSRLVRVFLHALLTYSLLTRTFI